MTSSPHMLIAGGTGGGKTYFILTIIEALLRCDSVMYVLDPKNADLADLAAVMPEVCCKKEDITACIDRFYDGMMERSEIMKLMENYKTDSHRGYKNQKPIWNPAQKWKSLPCGMWPADLLRRRTYRIFDYQPIYPFRWQGGGQAAQRMEN